MKSDKTCNEGRFLHPSLGGAKMSKCPQCNQKFDKDFNAAESILLKT